MEDRRCFAQLLHPGGEHYPDEDGLKRWNREDHKRKFLRSPGRYIEAGRPHDGEFVFWGEWEPESRVVASLTKRLPDGPHFLYEPYYAKPSSLANHQNTDPFVFGEQFLYTGCLQHTKKGPTQLRNLLPGSLVLFGSCLSRSEFMVDTVFVVRDHVDHDRLDYRKQLASVTSETYRAVTIEPWYHGDCGDGTSYRLYFGATPENRVDGMFSFFPCLPSGSSASGFARPIIRIEDRITPNLTQGTRMTKDLSVRQLKGIWDDVVHQVTGQGLVLGVNANLPPMRASSPAR